MAVTVEILPAAQRQLDAADERWIDGAPLELAGPRCFQVGLGLAVQAGAQIRRQRGALGHR